MAKEKNALIRTRTVLILLLALTAFCSNPVPASFQRWMGRTVTSDSGWDRISTSAASELLLASADVEYTTFGLCSTVRIYEPQEQMFVGCFGTWYRVGMSSTLSVPRTTERLPSMEDGE